MREGPLAALDVIKQATGEDEVNAIGYCVGGTLMAVTLAWMAAKGDKRIASATFFAAQVDFTHAGDLMVFVDEEQLKSLEKKMAERGYLEGKKMANAFNMLRSNDLIWPYVITTTSRASSPTRSTCSTGIRIRRACRPPTTRSICAIAIWRTSSPRARW